MFNSAMEGLYLSNSMKNLNIKNDVDDVDNAIKLSYF